MTTFVPKQPVSTRESVVTVDAGLPAGVHRFQLVVVDAAGLKSAPVTVDVRIQRLVIGEPVIVDPRPPIRVPPSRVRPLRGSGDPR